MRAQTGLVTLQKSYSEAKNLLLFFRSPVAGTIKAFTVYAETGPVGDDAHFDLLVNGTSVLSGTPLALLDGDNDATVVLSVAVVEGDVIEGRLLDTPSTIGDDLTIFASIDETGANKSDSQLLDRANHTGTQLAATISDFNTAVDANVGSSAFNEAVDDRANALLIAGAALAKTYDDSGGSLTLDVNVDGATIEVNADALRVKAGGIGANELAATAVTPATYGDNANVAQFTVDADGRITAAANVALSPGIGGIGDFSSNTSTSVDSEVVLFSGTLGKTGKRATGSGFAKLTSGVLSAVSPASTDISDFNEAAQDAVGNILTDSSTIDFTYTDATPEITAIVKDASITEAKQVLADNTTGNVSTSAHGYAPKAPNDATKFLDGTGAYDTVKDSDLSTSDITTNDVSSSKHGFAPKGDGTTDKFLNANGAYSTPAAGSTLASAFLLLPQPFGSLSASNPGTNNRVWLCAFDVPFNMTVLKFLMEIPLGTGSSITIGIYNIAGSTNLGEKNIASTTAGVNTFTPASSIPLTPGSYWLAVAAATWGVSPQTVNIAANTELLLNGSKVRFGYATNTMSAGALPSTTGTINAAGGAVNFPLIKLETV